MAFSFQSQPLWLLLLIPCFLLDPSLSDPRAREAAIVCSNGTAPFSQRQAFVSNFVAALNSLTPLISLQGYGSTVNGTGNLSVYAFGECMKDLSSTDCNLCFAEIKTQIQKCLPYQQLTLGGRLFFDGCYLRYDDYAFYAEILTPDDKTVCGSDDFGGNQTIFKDNIVRLVKNLSTQAVNNSGFFDGSVTKNNVTVYGLAQCWEFVNRSSCWACLANAVSRISSCQSKVEGRALNAGCYMMYSTQKFYNISVTTMVARRGKSHLAVILATTLSAFASILLLSIAIFIGREKLLKGRREKKQLQALLSTVRGSGSVYKGKLPDGTVIAVKRLFFNTRQWVDHFFNEISLISSIQHKNLVRLLGCSITGPESLLVYEFVPNRSLHDHLFAMKENVRPISWEERYKIILGTAEGLAYLHEESRLRIIHRDIKLSNVLLDHDFTPKIADFGLVRFLPQDKSHLSTAIAGTLGYMAPEYVNNSFSEDSMCLLHLIWSLYVRGRAHEAVDRALEGEFGEAAASRLLQIGLLCVQADAELRPCMSMAVKMISDEDHRLPEPTQPPFLNSSGAEITRSIQRESASSRLLSRSNSSSDSIIESWINTQ
ncbi:hypothetical protein Nepgr_022567 [Nepenthes gracilis]|uniref:non-specific serine/threonine protein kinase n=1 Tax=Nepenthes gracilis TaxID=150966 RepID=A0AAD3T101_NEPGR|nr:hypothetical protein Nepgr_022567 [Nepenthes gracilis]